ncbi:hypothetical protein, partial [Pandoraea sp.]|uniref:hypothetical protein n=1 Tax=Pandoraea sp. TaxID=1883445 RepID=UPI0025F60945
IIFNSLCDIFIGALFGSCLDSAVFSHWRYAPAYRDDAARRHERQPGRQWRLGREGAVDHKTFINP